MINQDCDWYFRIMRLLDYEDFRFECEKHKSSECYVSSGSFWVMLCQTQVVPSATCADQYCTQNPKGTSQVCRVFFLLWPVNSTHLGTQNPSVTS